MLEKMMSKTNFRRLVYVFGALIEVIGFGLLFSFDKTISYLHQYSIVFSIVLIMCGYLLSVGVRR